LTTTASLFDEAFYAELARQKSAPEALRVAKKSMLKAFGRARPFRILAGFTLEGLAPPRFEQ